MCVTLKSWDGPGDKATSFKGQLNMIHSLITDQSIIRRHNTSLRTWLLTTTSPLRTISTDPCQNFKIYGPGRGPRAAFAIVSAMIAFPGLCTAVDWPQGSTKGKPQACTAWAVYHHQFPVTSPSSLL